MKEEKNMCERLYMMIDIAEFLDVQINWLQSDLFFYWKMRHIGVCAGVIAIHRLTINLTHWCPRPPGCITGSTV